MSNSVGSSAELSRTARGGNDIDDMQESKLSLMPEGFLESLSETQVRDLIAYLMHPIQVPLNTKPNHEPANYEPDYFDRHPDWHIRICRVETVAVVRAALGGKCRPIELNDLSSIQLFKSNIAKHDRAAVILQGKIAR